MIYLPVTINLTLNLELAQETTKLLTKHHVLKIILQKAEASWLTHFQITMQVHFKKKTPTR